MVLPAALAIKLKIAPAHIEINRLQKKLVESGRYDSLFNDFDMSNEDPWVPAIQFLGTKGYSTPITLIRKIPQTAVLLKSGLTTGSFSNRQIISKKHISLLLPELNPSLMLPIK